MDSRETGSDSAGCGTIRGGSILLDLLGNEGDMGDNTSAISIREISGDEYVSTGRAVADYAFGASPTERDLDALREHVQYNIEARNLVAFDGDQPQATVTSHAMTQNIRGRVMTMGGVAAVASMPSGRRRGAVRQLMEECFRLQHESDMAVSALYPFRDSFYERMGYVGFPKPRFLTLKPESLAPLLRLDKPGTCDQVSMKAGFDEWREFLERYQARTHGFALKHVSNALSLKHSNDWWIAFARHNGHIEGAMTFKITDYGGKLSAGTFYTTSIIGRYQLLDWVGRHTDQVKEAVIELAPDEYPELWFRDLEASVTCGVEHSWPGPMGRVIDVRGLSGISVGPRQISLDVSDAHCPWNHGTFTLASDEGRLVVEKGGAADTNLTIQGLSALVFTGHDPANFQFRGWGDPDAETQHALRALFPTVVPDMHETF